MRADAPEIIEIIDDDTTWFGDHDDHRGAPVQAPHDTARPRWVVPVAAAVLGAAIGYGVVMATISPEATTRPTQTSTPRTTAVTTPTTSSSPRVNVVSPVFYVADPPPSGLTMHFADTLGMGGNPADFTDSSTAEMWATDGASATTGSWFVVSLGTHHATGHNAFRTVAGDIEVTIEHDVASGQTLVSFTKDGDEFEITAFNWFDRQLLRLVASVGVSDSKIEFNDEFFASDHKLVLDADPATALYGLPVAWDGYTTALPAGLAKSVTITVGSDIPAARAVATRFALTDTFSFGVGDRSAIIGQLAADPRVLVAQWRDGERLITMRGNLGVEQMMSIAQTVHPSPSGTVRPQIDSASIPTLAALAAEPKTIVSGMLADGWPWTIQVSARNLDNADDGYLWWIGQPGDSTPSETRASLTDSGPSIETFVEHGRTYVLAKAPRALTGAQLHINPNGHPSTVMDLTEVDPAMADEFAAFVFLQPVPLTARIVDSTGKTVAFWPAQ